MPRESESPSVGWREVYRAMGADPSPSDDRLRADGGATRTPTSQPDAERCPDCKTPLRTGAADLCCDAHAERLRAADGRPD